MSTEPHRRGMRILIAGAGVAGQALAFWLSRGGHRVVVAERFPHLRAYGAQVDLRGQGIDAAKAMGLLDEIRARRVDEAGVAFVNAKGTPRATIMANTSGRGRQTLTSEYEIMRGDLVQILHDANGNDVDFRLGVSINGFDQDERTVTAHFSDGPSEEFDLLVGADGQGSRIRRALLPHGWDPYWRTGIHMAYWFVPRIASDGRIRDTYLAPGGRQIMRRSHNATETQAYFVKRETSAEFAAIHRSPVEDQQAFWAGRFADAGWQAQRFIDGMTTSPFFYSQEIAQVRIGAWSTGRVVLVGDAAHCASPCSGMGVSAGLVGAHVLAGQLNRHPDDLPAALAHYETELRPFVDEIQGGVNPKILSLGMPKTQFAINAFLTVTRLATDLRIPDLAARLARQDRGGAWQLPAPPRHRVDQRRRPARRRTPTPVRRTPPVRAGAPRRPFVAGRPPRWSSSTTQCSSAGCSTRNTGPGHRHHPGAERLAARRRPGRPGDAVLRRRPHAGGETLTRPSAPSRKGASENQLETPTGPGDPAKQHE